MNVSSWGKQFSNFQSLKKDLLCKGRHYLSNTFILHFLWEGRHIQLDERKQKIREKEQMKALVANEARAAGARKASLRAELVGLRQDTKNGIRAKKNDIQSLQQELSRLGMFCQMSNVALEGDRFLYNGIKFLLFFFHAPTKCCAHPAMKGAAAARRMKNVAPTVVRKLSSASWPMAQLSN
ncbi:uncharacterized protein LOC121798468 isoform X4 [Salvia splendens]|uniref:uncharacterized protein LOC121798468 isoform X4 n=1 Tax=Salvia splendens TaxID=180675 RepID=UPI001C26AED6|nr:uncharacterized protein LOC121798468 isoform X4 [Salvia splendens]